MTKSIKLISIENVDKKQNEQAFSFAIHEQHAGRDNILASPSICVLRTWGMHIKHMPAHTLRSDHLDTTLE